jgi:hypothetical protein
MAGSFGGDGGGLDASRYPYRGRRKQVSLPSGGLLDTSVAKVRLNGPLCT